MPAPTDSSDSNVIMWVIGGVCIAFSAVAAFLWGGIMWVNRRITNENDKLWTDMSKQRDKAHGDAIDHERRFATKQDLTELREHMDTKFNEITDLILKRNSKSHG